MPGPIVHLGATVLCSHAGQAQPSAVNPRVLVSGQPVAVSTAPYLVAGCVLPPPSAGNGPCVSASWVSVALRVSASGVPLVLLDSQAMCAPTGTPLAIVQTQTRVLAT